MRAEGWTVIAAAAFAALVISVGGCSTGSGPAPEATGGDETMELRSTAFEDGGTIPAEHATVRVEDGENVSIPYEWSGAPSGTGSYALALVDMHPVADKWVHWLVVDIPPDARSIEGGASGSAMPEGARELDSTYGTKGYGGPQPPPGTGEHSYVATIYALDVPSIDVSDDATLSDFEAAIEGHVLAEATVSGVFER